MNSKSDPKKLRKMFRFANTIATATGHSDLSLNSMRVLFAVAEADLRGEPLESRDVAALVGISTSGVSRAIAMMGEYHLGRPGLGLLAAIPDIQDRRRKPVTLTRKGLAAINKIVEDFA